MQHRSWKITEIRNGDPVATETGLSKQEAVRAIEAAMYGKVEAPVALTTQSVHDLALAA